METKVVSFKSDTLDIRVTVSEETAVTRMRRIRLQSEMAKIGIADQDEAIVLIVFYPDCLGSAISYEGFKMPTADEFMRLPGKFIDEWVDTAWALNPLWKDEHGITKALMQLMKDEDEKKELNSTSE